MNYCQLLIVNTIVDFPLLLFLHLSGFCFGKFSRQKSMVWKVFRVWCGKVGDFTMTYFVTTQRKPLPQPYTSNVILWKTGRSLVS